MKRSKISLLNLAMTLSLFSAICATDSRAQTAAKPVSTTTNMAKVDVNSADLKTLETLPGVGATIAKRIVAGRPYNSLADFEKVKGLGKTKADAIQNQLIFGPAVAAASAPTAKPATATASPAPTASSSTPKPATPTHSTSSTQLAPGEMVNINTASAADLDKLPGIGKTKAQAIIDYRTQNGPFKSLEDIEKVKGIKAGVFAKIKDHIKISD